VSEQKEDQVESETKTSWEWERLPRWVRYSLIVVLGLAIGWYLVIPIMASILGPN
jgi:hypothetical protein